MGQCQFLVKRKNRLCKLRAKEGSKYCGEHLTELSGNGEAEQRIPCPYDPDHSIFTWDLKRHLHVCNARPGPIPEYYSENLNVLWLQANRDKEFADIESEGGEGQEVGAESLLFRGMEPVDFQILVNKITKLHAKIGVSYAHTADIPAPAEPVSGTVKEVLQKDALASHIAAHGRFQGPSSAIVEMGCGKGGLSHHLVTGHTEAIRGCRFYLVDREGFKGKFDRRAEESGAEICLCRAKIDIKDLDLDKLLDPSIKHVAIISKHLCGAATCLALASLYNLRERRPDLDMQVFIALCCHHRCTLETFVGHEYLMRNHSTYSNGDVTPLDFARLCGMSSWAVCGWRYNGSEGASEEEAMGRRHFSGYTYAECTIIGWACKQIINELRLRWLRDRLGFPAPPTILPYISSAITPENWLLHC